jgi:hypothetical protein
MLLWLEQRGNTALLSACHAGQLDVVRWLVSEGHSDPRVEHNKVRWLHPMCSLRGCTWAAMSVAWWSAGLMSGRTSRRRWVCVWQEGATALMEACRGGHLHVVVWLVGAVGSSVVGTTVSEHWSCVRGSWCDVMLSACCAVLVYVASGWHPSAVVSMPCRPPGSGEVVGERGPRRRKVRRGAFLS